MLRLCIVLRLRFFSTHFERRPCLKIMQYICSTYPLPTGTLKLVSTNTLVPWNFFDPSIIWKCQTNQLYSLLLSINYIEITVNLCFPLYIKINYMWYDIYDIKRFKHWVTMIKTIWNKLSFFHDKHKSWEKIRDCQPITLVSGDWRLGEEN